MWSSDCWHYDSPRGNSKAIKQAWSENWSLGPIPIGSVYFLRGVALMAKYSNGCLNDIYYLLPKSTSSSCALCIGATYGSQCFCGLAVSCHLWSVWAAILGIRRREGSSIYLPSSVIPVLFSLLVFIWVNRMEIKNTISVHSALQVKIWLKQWYILAWSIFVFILGDISRFLVEKNWSSRM